MSTEISLCNMDLNSVDLSDARSLLVELVRALSPLANPANSATNALFLNRRFVPPQDLPTALYERHPVQVLVKLHEVQVEVEKWVGNPEEEQSFALTKESEQDNPEISSKSQTKAASSKENLSEARGQKDASISPLVREAKALVHQVQGAIAKLSSSISIQHTNEAILRDALKKLKPGLDRIIRTIAEVQEKSLEKRDGLQKEEKSRDLPSTPIPTRQKIVMQKLRELRQEKMQDEGVEKEKLSRKALPAQPFGKKESPQENQKTSSKEQLQREPISKNHKELRPQKPIQKNLEPLSTEPLPVSLKEKFAQSQIESPASEKQEQAQKNTRSEMKPVALPISPLIFDTKKIAPTRKKKKRKGFWFKDEEDTK